MIRVLDRAPCSRVEIDVDYLPLKVSWLPRGRTSLILRVSSSYGGELELMLEPRTGELVDAFVLVPPIALDDDPRDGEDADVPIEPGRPVLDRALWTNPDGIVETLLHPVYLSVPDVAWHRGDQAVVVRFCDEPIATRLRTDNVTIGVSRDRNLATLEVEC